MWKPKLPIKGQTHKSQYACLIQRNYLLINCQRTVDILCWITLPALQTFEILDRKWLILWSSVDSCKYFEGAYIYSVTFCIQLEIRNLIPQTNILLASLYEHTKLKRKHVTFNKDTIRARFSPVSLPFPLFHSLSKCEILLQFAQTSVDGGSCSAV
jgi:hypothetical protein